MRYSPRLMIERNRLLASKIYELLQEQPNISQAQLVVLVQQLIAKLSNDSVPLLGSVTAAEIDAESYPDAGQYNDIFQSIQTDLVDVASWHNTLISLSGTSVETHLSKMYNEQALVKAINLELNAISLRTAGLSANEWAVNLDLEPRLWEAALTTAQYEPTRREMLGATSSEEKLDIPHLELTVVQPDSNFAKLGYGQAYGTGTGTDEAALAAGEAMLDALTNDSDTDYFEYEALFIEPIINNAECPIAENHHIELQTLPAGISPSNFYWSPVIKQVEGRMPIGSVIPDGSNYQLRIRIGARFDVPKIVTKLKLDLRPALPGALLPEVRAVGLAPAGAVPFSPAPGVPDDNGIVVFTIPPTELAEIQVTLVQKESYRQRYQLNRAIVQLSDGKITNLLSDAAIG